MGLRAQAEESGRLWLKQAPEELRGIGQWVGVLENKQAREAETAFEGPFPVFEKHK